MRSRRVAAALAALAALAAAACGGTGEIAASATITIDSSGAYPIVRSEGAAPEWKAELVTELERDGVGDAAIGTIRSVLLDSTGAVYVVDPSYVQVVVFEPSGAFRKRIGRKGSGPGEYLTPYSIGWLGDSLAVLDPGNSRLMFWGTDGKWAGQFITQRYTGSNVVRLYRTPPRGFWALASRPGADGTSERLFVRYTAAGPIDSIRSAWPSQGANNFARCNLPNGGFGIFSPPLGAIGMVIPMANGFQALAVSTSYRITLLDAAHDTVRAIERTVIPAPVTDAEWHDAGAEMRDWRAKNPSARCDRDGWDRPALRAPLESIFVDDEGQLWAEVVTAGGREYDVYRADGTLRATVRGLPPTRDVEPSVVNGRIAFAVADSLDVQSVQVFRLGKR